MLAGPSEIFPDGGIGGMDCDFEKDSESRNVGEEFEDRHQCWRCRSDVVDED